jgi:hypothetical protein
MYYRCTTKKQYIFAPNDGFVALLTAIGVILGNKSVIWSKNVVESCSDTHNTFQQGGNGQILATALLGKFRFVPGLPRFARNDGWDVKCSKQYPINVKLNYNFNDFSSRAHHNSISGARSRRYGIMILLVSIIEGSKKSSGLSARENIIACGSYKYLGDESTKIYHKKDAPCIDEIETVDLHGLGEKAKRKGWTPCPVCVTMKPTGCQKKLSKKKQTSYDNYIDGLASYCEKTKAQIMEEQIAMLCQEHGMYAAFEDGTAFITTVAGEWFFAYNDRPIKLSHRNYSEKLAAQGKSYQHYHLQTKVFPAPLSVICYIRKHEIQLRNRMMDELSVEDYM